VSQDLTPEATVYRVGKYRVEKRGDYWAVVFGTAILTRDGRWEQDNHEFTERYRFARQEAIDRAQALQR
jgi:hypothetical protein